MKKVMPYLCNLYNRWSNKRLIRLLALLLALAVPAPVLLGGDDDQDRNNGREHGRFVDPIVGSWIIHVTVENPPPSFKFDNMAAFSEDGITTSSGPTSPGANPTESTAYGVWKKMGPRTYFTKIVEVNSDGTLGTVMGTSELNGDVMTGTFQGMVTDSTGTTVLAQFSGEVKDNRITFDSTP
jgi:hypothetical protein